MPDPTEIRMLSDEDYDQIMKSKSYLSGRGAEHDKQVKRMEEHFKAKSEYEEYTKRLDFADDAPLYIWITQGDERVRTSHAERDGGIFDAANPPEGGNPGDDYNCRCKGGFLVYFGASTIEICLPSSFAGCSTLANRSLSSTTCAIISCPCSI